MLELFGQLRPGRVHTRIEQRLQMLLDLFCGLKKNDKHILQVVQVRCSDSTGGLQARLARMHGTMSKRQHHALPAHQECESAFLSISLIQEHLLLVLYEATILQRRASEAFPILKSKFEMAQVDQQEQ